MANIFRRIKDGGKALSRHTTKSRIIRFVVLLALTLWASIILLAMDVENYYRPEWLGGVRYPVKVVSLKPKVVATDYSVHFIPNFLFNTCGLETRPIHYSTWIIFLTAVFAIWAFTFLDIFGIKFKKKLGITPENPSYKRKNITYNAIFVLIIAFLVILALGIYFSTSNLPNSLLKLNGKIFLNLLETLLISIISIIIVPLIILVFYLILVLIIYLFGYISQNVVKRVIANREVQRLLDKAKEESENPIKVRETGENAGNGSGTGENTQTKYDMSVEKVFPSLNRIDQKYTSDETAIPHLSEVNVTLEEIVKRFRAYLCHQKLYFDERTIRNFIGGLSVSRLMILEGLSGTGKSTLPRLFSEFVGNKVFYSPVQATWRDRTDLVGYYSDFTNEYKETDFLKRLYEANYRDEEINMMVLDEMNISRIEYYFADFLSILEYPAEDWLIKVMQIKDGQGQPQKFVDGNVRIPKNTWFIGTANTDDSTFTITDKVYDRAIVIDFLRINDPFELEYNDEEIHISADELQKLFEEAKANESNRLNSDEKAKFRQLCDFVLETFNVTFGNRIMNQIENFVPVYVALGGTKVEALDFIFSRKVMRKLQGKYDEYVKDGLGKMLRFINTLYGKDQLPYTEEAIVELRKKLI